MISRKALLEVATTLKCLEIVVSGKLPSILRSIYTEFGGSFSEGYTGRRTSKKPARQLSEKEELKQLRQEVDYLKQEIEFLKKFLDQNYTEVAELLGAVSS